MSSAVSANMSSFRAICGLIVFIIISTEAVPPRTPDELQDQLVDIKTTLGAVTTQLDKFNALYLNKLETRMVVASSVLTSVETKVNSILERSHAWDTFQLHVSSWNEQMHTINNKMDLLSRGQEEQAKLEARLSTLQGLDYKLDRLSLRLEDMDRRLIALSKEKEAQRENPIVGEFAARGLLTTLKAVERKVDRVTQQILERGQHKRSSRNEGNSERNGLRTGTAGSTETFSNLSALAAAAGESAGRIVIRCQAPRAMDELLRDVAAKVDYMFDRTQGRKEEGESTEENGGEETREQEENERVVRRCEPVSRDTTRKLDELIEAVQQLKSLPSVQPVSETVDVDRLLHNLSTQTARRAEVVASFCKEQRAFLESALDRRLNPHTLRALMNPPVHSVFPTSTTSVPCAGSNCTASSLPQPTQESTTKTSQTTSLGKEPSSLREPTLTTFATVTPSTTMFKPLVPRSCEDIAGPDSRSGVFKFAVDPWEGHGDRDYSERFCDMQTSGGGWTVIQRRGDFGEPRENFTRSWEDYRDGFGDLEREFWFGNDFIHRLTYDRSTTLRIDLEDFDGNTAWAEYEGFRVGSEDQHYELTLGKYSGNASDSLSTHHGAAFSTTDRNHDMSPPCCPCAQTYGGGWWFRRYAQTWEEAGNYTDVTANLFSLFHRSCFDANLNGVYHTSPEENNYFRGIIWEKWLGDYSLKSVSMKVRSSNF